MADYIYARISSNSSDKDNQVENMQEKWGPGLQVIGELKSGLKKRPKLMHLIMEKCKAGDRILIAHSDRLTRSGISDYFMILAAAKQRGIKIVSLHEGELDTNLTPLEELQVAIRAFGAHEEAMATKRRIQDMFARRAREGKLSGVYLAIQRGNHHHGHKELNPVIQSAIPRMVALRAEGHAYRKIAEILSKEFQHKFNHAYVHELITRQAS